MDYLRAIRCSIPTVCPNIFYTINLNANLIEPPSRFPQSSSRASARPSDSASATVRSATSVKAFPSCSEVADSGDQSQTIFALMVRPSWGRSRRVFTLQYLNASCTDRNYKKSGQNWAILKSTSIERFQQFELLITLTKWIIPGT